ncbi:hypothetical protein Pfo_002280 [Paulownia fortunei]|nr:hypothetical protein Pfo_002280 [Paulownia fortunei]
MVLRKIFCILYAESPLVIYWKSSFVFKELGLLFASIYASCISCLEIICAAFSTSKKRMYQEGIIHNFFHIFFCSKGKSYDYKTWFIKPIVTAEEVFLPHLYTRRSSICSSAGCSDVLIAPLFHAL